MFCKICGSKLAEGTRFCGSCGAEQPGVSADAFAPDPRHTDRKGTTKYPFILGGAALAAVAIGLFAWKYFTGLPAAAPLPAAASEQQVQSGLADANAPVAEASQTSQTPEAAAQAQAASTADAQSDLDRVYQSRLETLIATDASDTARCKLFEQWIDEKYGAPVHGNAKLTAAELEDVHRLGEISFVLEFYASEFLSDYDLFESIYLFYQNEYTDRNFSMFKPKDSIMNTYGDAQYAEGVIVEHETVQRVLQSVYGVALTSIYQDPDYPYADGSYRISYGDPDDYMDLYVLACTDLGDDTYYVTYDAEDYDGGWISDCTGVVVKRNSASPFGFTLLARRGYRLDALQEETTSAAATSAPAATSGKILPDLAYKYYTTAEIYACIQPWCNSGYTVAEVLRLARNECYANHGRVFKDEALNRYFYQEHAALYTPNAALSAEMVALAFNKYEQKNITLIADMEKLH